LFQTRAHGKTRKEKVSGTKKGRCEKKKMEEMM